MKFYSNKRLFFLMFVCWLSVITASGQQQFIVLQNGRVLLRFKMGSYVRCVMNDHSLREGKIVEMLPFTLITTNDTIPIQNIKKIDLRHHRDELPKSVLRNLLGFGSMATGFGYVAVDQINSWSGKNASGLDQSDARALIIGAAGGLIVLIKPRYIKSFKVSLRVIDYHSPFFKGDQ